MSKIFWQLAARTVLLPGLVLSSASFAFSQTTPTLDSEQVAFLGLINNYRAQNGVGPLQVSVALENSSQWMSTDMATKNYFSHTDSLGRDPFTRMAAFNYRYSPAGENIAAGSSDAQSTFNQWLNACDADASGNCTYAHRQNMVNRSYTVIGIGRAYNAAATYRWYWTTDFGAYLDQTINVGGVTAPPTITSFTANPAAITAGAKSTLSWTVSGASSVTIDNGVGTVTGTSVSVTPTVTTTYHLSASNSAGTVTAATTVTVGSSTPPATGVTSSIWSNSTVPPVLAASVGTSIELGVKFRSDVKGTITGIRFYKGPYNSGTHTGSLWTSSGSLLATGTFQNETASGWQTLVFQTPVAISSNTTYIASYHSTTGVFSMDSTYFLQHGADSVPLHALQNGVDGPNGVYAYSSTKQFPASSAAGYNFWVDVLLSH